MARRDGTRRLNGTWLALLGALVLASAVASAQSDRTQYFIDLLGTSTSFSVRAQAALALGRVPPSNDVRTAVTAAQVNLYYPPEPGRTRPKVVTIEVTSKGRLNLHKFDAKMQAQLEGYLVAVGILQKGQTLSAQELPPEADAVSSSSAFED